ncbi:hypothetical protein HA45_22935 [Pantoea rodasii]|nr:hypothetical protein HA45_22935 [Pantoea rodasii]
MIYISILALFLVFVAALVKHTYTRKTKKLYIKNITINDILYEIRIIPKASLILINLIILDENQTTSLTLIYISVT